jgi:transcription initiation factor TFIIIB Brf1 subunit/transcription initiation factor TFIIB
MIPGKYTHFVIESSGKRGLPDREKWFRLAHLNNQRRNRMQMIYMSHVRVDCKALDLPWFLVETATRIFMECWKEGKLRGRSVDELSKACIYYAAKIHRIPMAMKTLWPEKGNHVRSALRCAGESAIKIYPASKTVVKGENAAERDKNRTIDFCNRIESTAAKSCISEECKKTAKRVYADVMKHDKSMFIGKNPNTIIAAVLFIAAARDHHGTMLVNTARGTERVPMSQRNIAYAVGVTEVSLRSRAKQIVVLSREIEKKTGQPIAGLATSKASRVPVEPGAITPEVEGGRRALRHATPYSRIFPGHRR